MPRTAVPAPPTADEGFPEDLERALCARVEPLGRWSGAWLAEQPDDLPDPRWGFGEQDADRVATVWDAAADALADEVIASVLWSWPWAFRPAAEDRHPRLVVALRDLAARRLLTWTASSDTPEEMQIEMALNRALSFGAYDVVRRRRSWPHPPASANCAVCGDLFDPAITAEWLVRRYGVGRYCGRCLSRSEGGVHTTARHRIRRGLRRMAAVLGTAPPSAFRQQVKPVLLPPDRRDAVMRALIAAPARTVPPYPSHLAALQHAGIVGEAWRPGRGTMCMTADGHVALSLGEKAVDDWLTAHAVAHEHEPVYPVHPVLNPAPGRRADWRLTDGTLVEYAGMLAKEDYARRFAAKEALAAALGIRLIVIRPADLYTLDAVLGSAAIPSDGSG